MKDLKKLFAEGECGYTPAAMWFTSGNINKKEMTYQIEGFSDKGIKDFFIHPSNGTEGDYLGEHFFDMIKHATSEAERLDMNFWMYDEYNWPSGIAGGQVLRDAPWARSSRLIKMTKSAAAGETLVFDLPSKERFNTEVHLFSVDGVAADVTVDGERVSWTNGADSEKTLEIYMSKWIMGKTFASLGSNAIEDTEGYLDTLDKDAVKVFIEKTHEVYKKEIGEHFGKHAKGIFSDEVTAYYEMRDPDERGLDALPWTRLFPEKFMERCGYDIRPRLKELIDGSDAKLSIDYWDTIGELFVNGFAATVGEWCRENGLIFTGHIDAEESLTYAAYGSGDPYEYYKQFTWPGIDTIFTYYRINDYSYNIAPKLAASAAHFHGQERVLSETYTVSGWDIRLCDMKRIFNRLMLHGINFIQFMGARYAFMPGSDSAAMTNNWQNPLFKHYGTFSKYISALQSLVANTKYDAKTLIFYPLTSVKPTLKRLPTDIYIGEMNDTFTGAINSLLNLNVPFEIGFEQVINDGEIKDGKIKFKDLEYHTLVMPGVTHLREVTYKKLLEFARGGGRIVMINCAPIKVIGDTVYDAEDFLGAVKYECREFEMCGENATHFDSYQRATMGKFTAMLSDAIADMPSSTVKINACDGIMSAVRVKDDVSYVIIINDNPYQTVASGKVLSDKPFCAVDTETGDVRKMQICGREFEMTLAPFECVVIEISDSALQCESRDSYAEDENIELYGVEFATAEKNIALPDVYQVRGAAKEKILDARRRYNPRHVCDIAAGLGEDDMVACRGYAIGDLPIKAKHDWFGWMPIDKKPITMGETVVCVYDFTLDFIPEDLEMVTDPTFNTVWYINNEQLYPSSVRRVWHYANQVYSLSDVVKLGKNRMVSICTVPACDKGFAVPCAMLRGSFKVYSDFVITDRTVESKIDVWNGQGYALYAGDGIYKAKFNVTDKKPTRLALETSDVTEIFVNGERVAKRLWHPFEADITSYISEGENTLELRVTSTYSNFMYNSNPSGIKSAKIFTLK